MSVGEKGSEIGRGGKGGMSGASSTAIALLMISFPLKRRNDLLVISILRGRLASGLVDVECDDGWRTGDNCRGEIQTEHTAGNINI